MASRKRTLLTAGPFSIFRPLDAIGTLFFSQIHNLKGPARSCFHSAWSYHLGRWAQSNTCQRLSPPSSPAAKLYGLCSSWPLELMQANKESGGTLFYLLEFCKQLIWPCPLDEPGLIRMPFILQWFLKNRKLNASEQSSSCLQGKYACRLALLGKKKRCSKLSRLFCTNPVVHEKYPINEMEGTGNGGESLLYNMTQGHFTQQLSCNCFPQNTIQPQIQISGFVQSCCIWPLAGW